MELDEQLAKMDLQMQGTKAQVKLYERMNNERDRELLRLEGE